MYGVFTLCRTCCHWMLAVRLYYCWMICCMMTSSNGNIFRVTGHLCGEFTVTGEFPAQRPLTRSFDIFFDLCLNKRLRPVIWDAIAVIMTSMQWETANRKYGGDKQIPIEELRVGFSLCEKHVVTDCWRLDYTAFKWYVEYTCISKALWPYRDSGLF